MNRNGPFQDRVGSIWDRSRVNIALYCKNRAFCSSSVPFMSYLDVFKKKLTIFADEMVINE